MMSSLRETIIENLKNPLRDYNENYQAFQNIGKSIETTLQNDTEILAEIRRNFDNLSAAVELEFEGTYVFDQEIHNAKDLLHESVAKVNESSVTSQIVNDDLSRLAEILQKIHDESVRLDDLIKNINTVSESIEVASRNAGITAFHAGTQGRGFEVIAREMTGLVRSSQVPTRMIPMISSEIIKNMVELSVDLKKISDIVAFLREIIDKFTKIVNDLLSFIPEIETSIKGIGESIASQKELHHILLKENEKLNVLLQEVFNTTNSSAIMEIYLAALFQHITNVKDNLLKAGDDSGFAVLYDSLFRILSAVVKRDDREAKMIIGERFEKIDAQSSDRVILQFVSEANHLNQIIQSIAQQIKNWSKTNNLSVEVLSRGVIFYNDISEILQVLKGKLDSIRHLTGEIDPPLKDLRKITERSRILGLYAGIESARGGEFATSLGVVTREIKNLSQKTAVFVEQISEIEIQMLEDFFQLGSNIGKSMSDVEQGISSLRLAIKAATENKKVLENLDNLASEMSNSLGQMISQCRLLETQTKAFSEDYKNISASYVQYAETVSAGTEAYEKILRILADHKKEVAIIERKSRTLVLRESNEPILLDPAKRTDTFSHYVVSQFCMGLMSFDSSIHLIPGVADSFTVSRDGCVWDFTMKKNVRFHDGRPVTARDMIASIDRIRGGPNDRFVDRIEEAVAVNDYRIRFRLKNSYIPFLSDLACGPCDITPPDFDPEKPVGCGPYRLVEWNKGKEIVLEAFDDFFDGTPAIPRVVIKMIQDENEALDLYKAGEISMMRLGMTGRKHVAEEEQISGPVLSTHYVAINLKANTPFRDRRIRQAMNYACDKEYYAHTMMQNELIPAYGIFPPGMPVFNKDLVGYRYDLAKARELMREAGYPNGIETSFVMDFRGYQGGSKRADFIRDSLEKIGIKVVLNPMSWKDFLDKSYKGECILSLNGWMSDNGDPDNFLFPLFHSNSFGSHGNVTFYSNPEVESLIEIARSERSAKRRIQLCRKIEQLILNDAPWIITSHQIDRYAVKKNVRGFKVDPFGLIRFRNLWIDA